MIEPFSTVCLATLTTIISAIKLDTVVGGIAGNRADGMFCNLMRGCAEHFLQNAQLPENQDLLVGMVDAYQRSLAYVADTLASQSSNLREKLIADKIVKAAKNKLQVDLESSIPLIQLLTPLLAGEGEGAAELRREQILAVARQRLIESLEAQIGETLPENFRRLFAETAPNGRAPWHDIYRLYLSEKIQTEPRFERMFLANNVAQILGRTITIEQVVAELGNGLDDLSAQISGLEVNLNKVDVNVRHLVEIFEASLLGERARQANVETRAFILLARRINQEVEDESHALSELNRAVEELLKVKATAEQGTNLDDLVDLALRQIAAYSLRGEFKHAASAAEDAFADWERREAERRSSERRAGLMLVEANIQQHLFLRDIDLVVRWIERRLVLERQGTPADTDSLLVEVKIWYERGVSRGLNLDLAVAISLAERALALSSREKRWAALGSLGNALKSLGEREPGTARLEAAVSAYREALKERTQERVPLEWAMTQNNLGNALLRLGERESGTARLEAAVSACREALKEHTQERVPLEWAATQNNLGTALKSLGER